MLNELLKAQLNNLACTNYSQSFYLLMQDMFQGSTAYKYFGF